MIKWLIVLGVIYISALGFLAIRTKRRTRGTKDFIFAGSNIGLVIGIMSFAATLFSTFTLMGLPDFFRIHGVGAWIFLAFSDGVMVFFILFFGYHLRKKVAARGFHGISQVLQDSYRNKWAGYVYFICIFLFLIPYTAIQIRGIAIFLHAAFPGFFPIWVWALGMIVLMLLYSETGGLKAIMFADVLQGTILLIIVWVIAWSCIESFGSMKEMFTEVERIDARLLSVPGPNGLFSFQFLLASMLVIVLIPVTQPQLTTRLVIMQDLRTTHRLAIAVGCFAMLIILPTAFIGFYGAVRYPEASTADFLAGVLLFDQPGFIAAAAIIGLIAAALSTSDSQIFAMGSELRSLIAVRDKTLTKTRVGIIFFALAALVFSLIASDRLVMLARVSFAGTALAAPMILAAILRERPPSKWIVVLTALAIVVFLCSLLELIPATIWILRMDLALLLILGIFTVASVYTKDKSGRSAPREMVSNLNDK
ncbi:MAG: sodium:solute symporter [Bacteroides sp. SM1_62]|nr:MAG: sodium:solute symporter [Bacteroides sp. SM1_62]